MNSELDVKAIRLRTGFSQQQFADLLGVSVSLVESWEQNRRMPSGSSLKLLKVLDRKPDWKDVLLNA